MCHYFLSSRLQFLYLTSSVLVAAKNWKSMWKNKALYGDCPMTRWWERFFWNCMNLNPSDHFVVLFSFNYVASISLTSEFARSTDPWLCGCLGRPCTILRSGHKLLSSVIMLAVNSRPLSLWRIKGAPRIMNMSSMLYALCRSFSFQWAQYAEFGKMVLVM